MSLDVYLTVPTARRPSTERIYVREDGRTVEITRAEWDERFPDREPAAVVIHEDEAGEVFWRAAAPSARVSVNDAGVPSPDEARPGGHADGVGCRVGEGVGVRYRRDGHSVCVPLRTITCDCVRYAGGSLWTRTAVSGLRTDLTPFNPGLGSQEEPEARVSRLPDLSARAGGSRKVTTGRDASGSLCVMGRVR